MSECPATPAIAWAVRMVIVDLTYSHRRIRCSSVNPGFARSCELCCAPPGPGVGADSILQNHMWFCKIERVEEGAQQRRRRISASEQLDVQISEHSAPADCAPSSPTPSPDIGAAATLRPAVVAAVIARGARGRPGASRAKSSKFGGGSKATATVKQERGRDSAHHPARHSRMATVASASSDATSSAANSSSHYGFGGGWNADTVIDLSADDSLGADSEPVETLQPAVLVAPSPVVSDFGIAGLSSEDERSPPATGHERDFGVVGLTSDEDETTAAGDPNQNRYKPAAEQARSVPLSLPSGTRRRERRVEIEFETAAGTSRGAGCTGGVGAGAECCSSGAPAAGGLASQGADGRCSGSTSSAGGGGDVHAAIASTQVLKSTHHQPERNSADSHKTTVR